MFTRRSLAASAVPLVLFGLVAACGGRTLLTGIAEEDGGTVDSGGTPDAGGTTGITVRPGPGACVIVEVSPSALSCMTDSDCTIGLTGEVCAGDCPCGDTAMNTAAAASVTADTARLATGNCACGMAGEPRCVSGQCKLCEPAPSGASSCDTGVTPPTDGGVIVYDSGVIVEDGGVIGYDGGVIGYDGGVIVEDGGVIGYDGGVIVEDGGEACPGEATVGAGVTCSFEGQSCSGWVAACGGVVEGCHCEGYWVCPPIDCADAGPPTQKCEVGGSCGTWGETCRLRGAGPCGSDVRLICSDSASGAGTFQVESFPCSSAGAGCGWTSSGGGCSESCTCQAGSMVCTGNCPDAGLSSP